MKSWIHKIKPLVRKNKWILILMMPSIIFPLFFLEKKEKVIFLKTSLPQGTLLQPHHFSLKSIAAPSSEGYFTLSDVPRLNGGSLLEDVSSQEPLLPNKVKLSYQVSGLSELIPKGFRAHTLVLPKIPPIKKNDFVDVFTAPGKAVAATLLVEALKVLEVRKVEPYFEVTLILSPQEIEFIERARQKTTLFLVIRNPKEIQSYRAKALTQSKKSSVKLWIEVP